MPIKTIEPDNNEEEITSYEFIGSPFQGKRFETLKKRAAKKGAYEKTQAKTKPVRRVLP